MRNILAIDDNNDNLVVYKAILKRYYDDCSIITCKSGQDGIDLAAAKQPDTILLDIIMPGMDGFETCKKLKANPLTKHIPIILITAIRGDHRSRIKGLEIGADAFLSKPIEEDEFIAQINVMLRIKDAEDKLRERNRGLEIDVKQKIDELEASRRTMSNLLNNLPGFAYQCLNDKDWTVQYISQACEKITGYSPDDFTTNKTITFNDIIHPDYREHLWNTWQKKLNLKAVFQEEYPITNANGDTRWVWEQASGVFQNDKLLYIEGFITDITQRKISEYRFKDIFNQSPIGIALVDSLTGQIIQVNSKYCQILDLPEKELTQLTWQSLTHPDDIQTGLDDMAKLNSGETNGYTTEKRYKQPDGSFIWVNLTTAKMDILNSEASCHLAMLTDISERKQLTQSLINAKEKAEESDRLKSSFLASMSHELRTPLNAVIGFSGLIQEDLPLSDILYFSEVINSSGSHLLDIIEDLFDISLIETGDIKIVKEPMNIFAVFDDVQDIIKNEQILQEKVGIDLQMHINIEELDSILISDQKRIKQILINLLKNALKFTSSGSIEFGCSLSTDNKQPQINFFVKDTGIGIPKAKQKLIFEVFRQADESQTRIHGGTGLGLTICKRLTDLMGGDIWVESKEGKGASFYFTIPLTKSESENLDSTIVNPKLSIANKTVLIAEDDETSYLFLETILTREGISCIWVKDGLEAVEYCQKSNRIDLILMDINMPKMNGYEATKQIKEIQPELPIIAQTAFAIEGDKEKILASGCDDYISKPINKANLFEKIQACFEKATVC